MGAAWKGPLEKIDDYRFRIPKTYKQGMRVDGIIYADEKMLQEIRQDQAPEQVANVAFLPGIVKYSLAMPDIHWGYGFSIGGVAATDPQEGGVISPGGVGYDINCLSPDTQILMPYGYVRRIADLETDFQKTDLTCMDLDKHYFTQTKIKQYIKIRPPNRVFKLKTYSGREIIATEDHPFWTPQGMVTLARLKEGDWVGVYPFQGVHYEKPSSQVIVDEGNIKKILLSLGQDSRGHGWEQIIKWLKKLDLVPLRYDSWQLPYLLKIMGYVFGDGTIYFNKKRRKGITWFYGKKEDLEKIGDDVLHLGFSCSKVYFRKREHKIKTNYAFYEFNNIETSCKVGSTSFAALLVALGVPLGNKTNQDYNVPSWIWQAPLWQKRLFLAGFLGAELSSPKTLTGHDYNFYAPVVSMNKKEDFVEGGVAFLKSVAKLLKEFNVQSRKISQRIERINIDNDISYRLRLMLANTPQSMINLYSRVGFEYNARRSFLANVATQYLKMKEKVCSERRKIALNAQALHKATGKGGKYIYQQMGSDLVNLRFIERSIYEGRKTSPRVSFNTLGFVEFLENNTRGLGNSGVVWDEVISKEEIKYTDYVYDFTVDHLHHNFIANNFVVSNCGVRLVKTHLFIDEVKPKIKELTSALFHTIPAGVGSTGDIKISVQEERTLLVKGARWAVERGYGTKDDLECTEEGGCIEAANPEDVSDRAYERGKKQSGTLGSGNHFLEVQEVERIYDRGLADRFGLKEGQITIMIHSGSRGLGYQVCDDYLEIMGKAVHKYNISLPDRQLACAPVESPEAKSYISAMGCAANYAWANRQCLMYLTRLAFERIFKKSWESLGMFLIYDVAHNIAKFEKYNIEGKEKTLCVHRKGATRAFGPGHPELPQRYKDTGQPVIIPGDMGRNSFLLVGTNKAEETFYSTCFSGDTRILTDKGIVTLKEIYEFNKLGVTYKTLSINKNTLSTEWKTILGVSRRIGAAIRISVSQTNRSRFSVVDTSPDHKFLIFENAKLKAEEIGKIIENQKMLCVLDRIEIPWTLHYPRLAFLVGALVTDGYIDRKNKRIIFTQKKTDEKLNFIAHVKSSFQFIFEHGLSEGKEKVGGGYIRGKAMVGTATDFVTARKHIAEEILGIFDNLQTWVLGLNRETTLNFLAGVIDGDGTWNPIHNVIDIFNSKEKVVGAVVLACLKLGVLPYVSIQRDNCYIIQISEKLEEILRFTKRVKGSPHWQKYGSKLFALRQLFTENWKYGNIKWPFKRKTDRNNLMEGDKILKFLAWQSSSHYNRKEIIYAINSPLRMQRVKKIMDLGTNELYNIDVEDNHNYFVFTKTFIPVLVKNCHGAGRVMSRTQAIKSCSGRHIPHELEEKGIIVMASSRGTLAEEIPEAYKDVNAVVKIVAGAGISKIVCRMRPLGVIKG